MKLSEAIRLGAMATEPARGFFIERSSNGIIKTCAFGSAVYAAGQLLKWPEGNRYIIGRWPWVIHTLVKCPACRWITIVMEIIIHLNDYHGWSRERTAFFVSMIEPQEQVLLEDQRKEQPDNELVAAI